MKHYLRYLSMVWKVKIKFLYILRSKFWVADGESAMRNWKSTYILFLKEIPTIKIKIKALFFWSVYFFAFIRILFTNFSKILLGVIFFGKIFLRAWGTKFNRDSLILVILTVAGQTKCGSEAWQILFPGFSPIILLKLYIL